MPARFIWGNLKSVHEVGIELTSAAINDQFCLGARCQRDQESHKSFFKYPDVWKLVIFSMIVFHFDTHILC